MIGIDIVDHSDVLLKKRTRQDLRFISHPNDHFKVDTLDDDRLWWVFWAAKEAVFKSKRKDITFDPKAINVVFEKGLETNNKRTFQFESGKVRGEIELTAERTLAVVTSPEVKKTHFETFKLSSDNHSQEVRNKSLHFLNSLKNSNSFEHTQDLFPAIKELGSNTILELSFTHHYSMGGFIVNLTNNRFTT